MHNKTVQQCISDFIIEKSTEFLQVPVENEGEAVKTWAKRAALKSFYMKLAREIKEGKFKVHNMGRKYQVHNLEVTTWAAATLVGKYGCSVGPGYVKNMVTHILKMVTAEGDFYYDGNLNKLCRFEEVVPSISGMFPDHVMHRFQD